MKADVLITGISQLATPEGIAPKHGLAMRELKVVEHAAIACAGGRVVWAGGASEWNGTAEMTVDVDNRAVVPGLIDPHTHAVWAGNRLADFEAQASGATYETILAAGGGIRSTIQATARASHQELISLAIPRVQSLLRSGATTIEVKSGYGFTPAAEIAILEAIHSIAAVTQARIVPTLLIHLPPATSGHRRAYLSQVREELVPEVARRKLAVAADVFVETEAWHADEAESMLRCAQEHGLAIKLHTEQFHCIGGMELAVRMGALSVDHLEAMKSAQLPTIAAGSTIATILPGVSLHLGIPAAPGRALVDAGAAVAVGSDLNPGSSPLFSSSLALALAVRLNGLTPSESLVAGTLNAACALGLTECGRIEAGSQADFLVLRGSDWRELIYTLGGDPVREVWIHGRRIVR